ncbi:MAG: TIGR00730 family Rossman fold protein [Acetobacteraceae bacterium]|nr:TIGR00730 family Rossman fold protein [Acetobacteraceae bacterium]
MNPSPTHQIRSVAVFCGSRFGNDAAFRDAAATLGAGLAKAGWRLVYGGGRVGLMGVVADAVLAGGGSVFGVIPDFLQRREVAHGGPVELVVTETMHERKTLMFDAADAFVTLPGGLGTFDETIEITTWRQLGLHDKPVLICDVLGWAQPYLAAIQGAVAQGFAAPDSASLYEVWPDVSSVLARLSALSPQIAADPERL